MTEYLKDLERWQPGEPQPPINLGPYDNPLLWNLLDPYGADRPHQRRPSSVSRTFLEMNLVPIVYRDHCSHRFVPWMKCIRNMRAMNPVGSHCHEFEHAWQECRQYERYRLQLLKEKFMELTKDYTTDDKKFFPDQQYIGPPWNLHLWFYQWAYGLHMAGYDKNDPNHPGKMRDFNRAMMRSEYNATTFEKRFATNVHGIKLLDPVMVDEELNEYPIPEGKKPPAGLHMTPVYT